MKADNILHPPPTPPPTPPLCRVKFVTWFHAPDNTPYDYFGDTSMSTATITIKGKPELALVVGANGYNNYWGAIFIYRVTPKGVQLKQSYVNEYDSFIDVGFSTLSSSALPHC